MNALCPQCGHDLALDEPISIEGVVEMQPYGECIYKGQKVHLTPGEASILWTLLKAKGRPVARWVLEDRIGYDGYSNVVVVLVSRLRAKLAAVGEPVPIENVHSVGWRCAA